MNKRRFGAALVVAALGLSLAGVAAAVPAFATPLPGANVQIENVTATIVYNPTREVQISFDARSTDPTDPGEVDISATSHDSCSTTTPNNSVIPVTSSAFVPESVTYPVSAIGGYVDVILTFSGGTSADHTQELTAADDPTGLSDVGASIVPDNPAVGDTGTIHINTGNVVGIALWKFLVNGVPNGPTRSTPACSAITNSFSGLLPGDVATVQFVNAGNEVEATYTVPGAVTPPPVTTPPTTPTTSTTPTTPTTASADPNSLAFTGVDDRLPAAIGAGVLVLGSLFLGLSIRRRRRSVS